MPVVYGRRKLQPKVRPHNHTTKPKGEVAAHNELSRNDMCPGHTPPPHKTEVFSTKNVLFDHQTNVAGLGDVFLCGVKLKWWNVQRVK